MNKWGDKMLLQKIQMEEQFSLFLHNPYLHNVPPTFFKPVLDNTAFFFLPWLILELFYVVEYSCLYLFRCIKRNCKFKADRIVSHL